MAVQPQDASPDLSEQLLESQKSCTREFYCWQECQSNSVKKSEFPHWVTVGDLAKAELCERGGKLRILVWPEHCPKPTSDQGLLLEQVEDRLCCSGKHVGIIRKYPKSSLEYFIYVTDKPKPVRIYAKEIAPPSMSEKATVVFDIGLTLADPFLRINTIAKFVLAKDYGFAAVLSICTLIGMFLFMLTLCQYAKGKNLMGVDLQIGTSSVLDLLKHSVMGSINKGFLEPRFSKIFGIFAFLDSLVMGYIVPYGFFIADFTWSFSTILMLLSLWLSLRASFHKAYMQRSHFVASPPMAKLQASMPGASLKMVATFVFYWSFAQEGLYLGAVYSLLDTAWIRYLGLLCVVVLSGLLQAIARIPAYLICAKYDSHINNIDAYMLATYAWSPGVYKWTKAAPLAAAVTPLFQSAAMVISISVMAKIAPEYFSALFLLTADSWPSPKQTLAYVIAAAFVINPIITLIFVLISQFTNCFPGYNLAAEVDLQSI